MTTKEWKDNIELQVECNIEIEMDDEKWKRSNWKEEIRLEKPFDGYREEFCQYAVWTLVHVGWKRRKNTRRKT